MMRIWLVVVVVALSACGKGVDAGTCRERAHALGTLLNGIDHDLPFADDVHLVVRGDLPRTSPRVQADQVDVLATEVRFRGDLIEDQADLRDRLAASRSTSRATVDPTLVVLVIDEEAPFATVAWVAGAAHDAGLTRAAFVFGRTPASVETPPRSWVDDDLDKLMSDEASQKAMVVAGIAGKITKSCPALLREFQSVASVEGDDKAQVLIDAIEPALIECNCTLDIPALRSVMYRLLYVPHPATLLTVTLAPDGRALALPGSTPWKTAGPQLRADDARVWLGVAASP